MTTTRKVRPGPRSGTVRTFEGGVLEVPAGWELLPPGDAGLTRKVKAAGPTWTVLDKRGRREFSQGVWACAQAIAKAQATVEAQRATPEYQRRLSQARARRTEEQEQYVREFEQHVIVFLDFHATYQELAVKLARRVAEHATPVGSGTVARTKRIPVEERAAVALMAWLRHQTTAYDRMQITRVKGRRREVRRQLAAESRKLLDRYRIGELVNPGCRLQQALGDTTPAAPPAASAPAPKPRALVKRVPEPAVPAGDSEQEARRARQVAVKARLARRSRRSALKRR